MWVRKESFSFLPDRLRSACSAWKVERILLQRPAQDLKASGRFQSKKGQSMCSSTYMFAAGRK